ncbi:adenylate/guanylate cyclase domain-containing protein [Aurantimonas coralicida]|uniref:adenylate/guanylate cyclase domain-containing protein n=1 Tax=Aurantimonas coralicida TaxID=182270 RepID=UPI0023F1C146|nr:adenylate/guanylate cyclase domain-containing protein [Aurantimonas coralicida]
MDCIRECSFLERSPGVGLYRGDVIATALGTAARADFTVLGRTVNLASRLCALARPNEIVIPASLEIGPRTDIEEQSRERVTPRHHQRSEEVIRYRLTR